MQRRFKCMSGLCIFKCIFAQQGMISISETKRNHMGQGLGYLGVRKNSYIFFLQKRRNYCDRMSVGIVMWKMDMFKTSGSASFLIILFQFLQYYVFIVLSGNAFSPALLLRLLHQRRRLHTKPSLHSTNVWQLFGVCCVSWPRSYCYPF